MRSAAERILLTGVLALAACAGNEDDPVDEEMMDEEDEGETGDEQPAEDPDRMEWNKLSERPCPEDSYLSWENAGGPYMLTYCTGCHSSELPANQRQGAPAGINFDSIDDVRTWAPRIWARAADQNSSMPPVGAPHKTERALLGEWLACGAPLEAELGD